MATKRSFRPRRVGGQVSQQIREQSNSWRTFHAAAGRTFIGTWRDQCFCGSVVGKWWRSAYWCVRCGREKVGFPHNGARNGIEETP